MNQTLLVEVLSESSEAYDRGAKLAQVYNLLERLRSSEALTDKEQALDVVKTQVQIIDCDGYIRALDDRLAAGEKHGK